MAAVQPYQLGTNCDRLNMSVSVIDATSTGSTGTVMVSGNMPAFSAYQSSVQTVSTGTWTKVQFQTKNFDTANAFDNTTNYRFTPQVAGYYQVNGLVVFGMTSSWATIEINKNGSAFQYGLNMNGTPNGTGLGFNSLIYMNGSTDYLELYVYQGSGGNQTINVGSVNSNFSASLVRAA